MKLLTGRRRHGESCMIVCHISQSHVQDKKLVPCLLVMNSLGDRP